MQQKNAKKGFRVAIYLYVLIILLSLLTVASYTWFSISQTPRVSDLYMYVNSPKGLEIALTHDAQEWGQQLDFRDMVDETAPLRPVTWSNKEQRFYAVTYGFDGRLKDIKSWQPLSDQYNANRDTYFGYYIKASFYARTDTAVKVSLSPAVEVDEGRKSSGTYLIGTPIWNAQEILHDNGGKGAENAIRVGLRITPVTEGVPDETKAVFYIYEPNSDTHINGADGYKPTPSIDGTPNLIDEEHLILQTASSWAEAYPVERNVVVNELGEFTTSTDLFTLQTGEMVKIDVYIWLEGQDADCTNQIEEAQILASIQFKADPDDQSGMVPIDDNGVAP